MQPYAQSTVKKAVNLTANADLVARAKENKLNLSEIFEEAILLKLRAIQQQEWLDQNKDGIEAYNERIERSGIFASKFRRF
ncbi:MAG: type II toxin-antitoxin system CcdA family antitoxin [Desulfuromonadaceae bacterium]|nr:type II toxin-antitoxin system CcdA family antitoxin [Desulfuromonadaceae bacterium]